MERKLVVWLRPGLALGSPLLARAFVEIALVSAGVVGRIGECLSGKPDNYGLVPVTVVAYVE